MDIIVDWEEMLMCYTCLSIFVVWSRVLPASKNASGTHPSRWIVSRLYFSTMGTRVGGLNINSYLRNLRPRRRIASATPSNGSPASFPSELSCSELALSKNDGYTFPDDGIPTLINLSGLSKIRSLKYLQTNLEISQRIRILIKQLSSVPPTKSGYIPL